jgi:hypothetical protein
VRLRERIDPNPLDSQTRRGTLLRMPVLEPQAPRNQKEILVIHLPMFTFLNAPAGSGKTTLAQLLTGSDPGLMHMSFAEPIRMALCAVFYPSHPTDPPDLRRSDIKAANIPGTSVTHREWMVKFSSFMKEICGQYIFGDLAKRNAIEISHYWPRFVFDDCRYLQELNPFSLAFGRENCLMIHIERTGKSWDDEKFDTSGRGDFLHYPGTRHILITNNGEPKDMLGQIARAL